MRPALYGRLARRARPGTGEESDGAQQFVNRSVRAGLRGARTLSPGKRKKLVGPAGGAASSDVQPGVGIKCHGVKIHIRRHASGRSDVFGQPVRPLCPRREERGISFCRRGAFCPEGVRLMSHGKRYEILAGIAVVVVRDRRAGRLFQSAIRAHRKIPGQKGPAAGPVGRVVALRCNKAIPCVCRR